MAVNELLYACETLLNCTSLERRHVLHWRVNENRHWLVDEWRIRRLIYPVEIWTLAAADVWCAGNDGTFGILCAMKFRILGNRAIVSWQRLWCSFRCRYQERFLRSPNDHRCLGIFFLRVICQRWRWWWWWMKRRSRIGAAKRGGRGERGRFEERGKRGRWRRTAARRSTKRKGRNQGRMRDRQGMETMRKIARNIGPENVKNTGNVECE